MRSTVDTRAMVYRDLDHATTLAQQERPQEPMYSLEERQLQCNGTWENAYRASSIANGLPKYPVPHLVGQAADSRFDQLSALWTRQPKHSVIPA